MSSIETDDPKEEDEPSKTQTQQIGDICERSERSLNDESVINDGCEATVEDTSASKSSAVDYLPSDSGTGPGIPSELLGAFHNPNIDEDTPAGEALRANAEVQVKRSAKFARKIHVNSVRQIVKKATRRGIGNRRGKPPRLPPHLAGDDGGSYIEGGDFGILEEGDEDSGSSSSNDEDNEEGYVIEEKQRSATSLKTESIEIPHNGENISNEVLDAGKKLLQVSDPHDILSNQQWKRRRRRDSDQDSRKSYVKGKVIDGKHELYALAIAIMLGVRTSIKNTETHMNGERRRWLSSDDFMATEKYKFKPAGSARTPPHQLGHTFKFKDYSPIAFAYLRRLFGINEYDFLISVCGNANFIEFISNAKSGQFFFYSSDGKFMIKTMTNAESKFLRRILPHYFRHCCQNPNTMLTKFLGMYRVKLYHLRRNVKFVIMNSVYYTEKPLHSFYDLKGSVTGRAAKPGQDVKKDNDLRDNLPQEAFALEPVTRKRLREQLVADCEFMRRMKIMDYSLLIGIHHILPKGQGVKTEQNVGTTGFRFSDMRKETLSIRNLLRSSIGSSMNSNSNKSDYDAPRALLPADFDSNGADSDSMSQTVGVLKRAGSAPTIRLKEPEAVKDDMKDPDRNIAPLAIYEHGLDDDDDNSYLEGSAQNPLNTIALEEPDDASRNLEVKKEQTIEKLYWPFHLLHDIHGYRRSVAGNYPVCSNLSGERSGAEANGKAPGSNLLGVGGAKIPSFTAPLSLRKDGGIMMDTTGIDLPFKAKTSSGKENLCEGKILYMGIIDILQQYNTRKRFETSYHRVQGSGWHDHSCVHPDVYADRFIQFFDEYSQRGSDNEVPNKKPDNEKQD